MRNNYATYPLRHICFRKFTQTGFVHQFTVLNLGRWLNCYFLFMFLQTCHASQLDCRRTEYSLKRHCFYIFSRFKLDTDTCVSLLGFLNLVRETFREKPKKTMAVFLICSKQSNTNNVTMPCSIFPISHLLPVVNLSRPEMARWDRHCSLEDVRLSHPDMLLW